MRKKKTGFTLVEALISVVVISIISVTLFKFYLNYGERMHDMSLRSEAIKIEYQDVLTVRASESKDKPETVKNKLNFGSKFYNVKDMTTSEREVWIYEGKYMQTYKMFD